MAIWYKDCDTLGGVVISSRVRLARNLSDMPFPRKMSPQMFDELKSKMRDAIASLNGYTLKFIEMNDVPEKEIKAMVERHVISPDFANTCVNRAIALSDDENICIMIGEEDHVRIQDRKSVV